MNWPTRWLQRQLVKMLTGEKELVLTNASLDPALHLKGINNLGLYLHIPFCRQLCPYCPFYKEVYHPEAASLYTPAVLGEIDLYAPMLANRPITSFYIGGGTPSTMLDGGLDRIVEHAYRRLNMQCAVSMEAHPNDLNEENLTRMSLMGVRSVSIGVEALQDRHLRTLCRPYAAETARAAVRRAVSHGFDCVNADVMFALPDQTCEELAETCQGIIELGAHQVTAYPLFGFPYTRELSGRSARTTGHSVIRRRQMLRTLEDILYRAGYQRTSVWAFTRPGVPKYSSVSKPTYLGLGAGAGSYLHDVFYLSTFSVREYSLALQAHRLPIALSIQLSRQMQMAGWLYWRIYETRFSETAFRERFGMGLNAVFGRYLKPLFALGWMQRRGDEVVLSDTGAFWLHALQDLFSIGYVGKLWTISGSTAWPKKVIL